MESQSSSDQRCEASCGIPGQSQGNANDNDEPWDSAQVVSQSAPDSHLPASASTNQSDEDSASGNYPGSSCSGGSVDEHYNSGMSSRRDGSGVGAIANGSEESGSESGYSSDSLNSLEVSPVGDLYVDVKTQTTVTPNSLQSPRVLYSLVRTTGKRERGYGGGGGEGGGGGGVYHLVVSDFAILT